MKKLDIISARLKQPTLETKRRFILNYMKCLKIIAWDIYVIKNTQNEKVYIGQSVYGYLFRFKRHMEDKRTHCIKMFNAREKYGKDKFYSELLKKCYSQKEADYWEDYYIVLFDSIDNGYNLKRGGANGILSEETKQKMSKIAKEKGTKPSKEASEKGRLARLGKPLSDEHKRILSVVNKGKIVSDETKEKISKTKIELRTPEQINKIKNRNEQKLNIENNKIQQQQFANNIRIEFNNTNISVKELSEKYNINSSYISEIINNKYWYDESYERTNFTKYIKKDDEIWRKLTKNDVDKIRYLCNVELVSQAELAKKYMVNINTISKIILNKSWHDNNYVTNENGYKIIKLNLENVKFIRDNQNVYTPKQLANLFNVSDSLVQNIIDNRAWKDNNYVKPPKTKTENYNQKLKDQDIKDIRENKDNLTNEQLAQKYNTKTTYIASIIANRKRIDPTYTPPVKSKQ